MLRKGKAKEGGKRMQKSSTRAEASTCGKPAAGSLRALVPYWMSWMHWRRISSLAVMGSAEWCSIHWMLGVGGVRSTDSLFTRQDRRRSSGLEAVSSRRLRGLSVLATANRAWVT